MSAVRRRKKGKATTGPHENPDLAPHSQPTTTSTPERKRQQPRDRAPATGSDSEPDPSPSSSPGSVRRLIEPYSRPRLLAILAQAAAADPALRARLAAAADASPSHRRIFVHGLPPRAGAAALAAAFSSFGLLADCHAVTDRATGRCRGYGFVSVASRVAARRALRDAPRVAVAGCPVSAQFASAGPGPSGGGAGRRVYVTNVAPDASAERLRAFFARFGELDGGPFGFDADTGSSRGYALFLYRAAAGAAKAVEEPYRVFEGRTLRCQLANEPARKAKAPPAAAEAPGLPWECLVEAGPLSLCSDSWLGWVEGERPHSTNPVARGVYGRGRRRGGVREGRRRQQEGAAGSSSSPPAAVAPAGTASRRRKRMEARRQ